jgi:mycoredoxin
MSDHSPFATHDARHDGAQTGGTTARDADPSGEIVMYSTTWCGDCRRAKRLLAALGVHYTEVNIAEHPEAAQLVRSINHGMQSVPTIVFPDGSILVEPGTRELEEKLRLFL